jgi:TetR/AcrR family transcriptional regulator, ethionamide resistance regulator
MSSTTRRARQRERRANTRGKILAAAAASLRSRPYRELSVEAVMTGTGLTRTAFYRHFDDIPDVVLRLLAEVLEDLYRVGGQWAAAAGQAFPAPARVGLRGVVDFFSHHGPLLRAIAEAAATDERIEEGYQGLREAFIALTTQTLERLGADGQLEVPDHQAMARALNLLNESYLLEEFGREPFGDPELVLATLETVWLRVLAPPHREPGARG